MKTTAGTLELLVGSPDANHLSLRLRGRADAEATGFWDGNWLKVEVAVRAGAFQGAFEADLRTDEFEQLSEQLAALEGAAEGKAALESAEGWVTLRLAPDQRGGLEGSCELRDDPAMASTLRFGVSADRAQVGRLRAALDELLRAYPVVGDPEEASSALLGSLDDLDEG